MQDTTSDSPRNDAAEFDDDDALEEEVEDAGTTCAHSTQLPISTILSEVLTTMKQVGRAAAALPQMQSDIAEIKKGTDAVLAYCKSLFLSSGGPLAQEDEMIQQQMRPVNSIFTKEYIGAAVASVLPKYTCELVADHDLSLTSTTAKLALATLVPQDNGPNNDTEAAAAKNSILKSLIVKLLIVHSASKAPIMTAISSAECSDSHSGVPVSAPTDGETSHASLPCEAPRTYWMKSGYIRPEIYGEVQREFEGTDTATEHDSRRYKKRKTSTDAERRDRLSKGVVKKVYVLLHKFFRDGRNSARRFLFEGLGFFTYDDAEAKVSFVAPNKSIANLAEIGKTHPLTLAAQSPEDDRKNAALLSQTLRERKEFYIIIEYKVNVMNGLCKSVKTLVQSMNLMNLALNFCVALTQCASVSKFLRSSTYSLRMVHVVAVSFRDLVEQYEVLQAHRTSGDAKYRAKWTDMIACWKRVLPGDSVCNAKLKESILTMTTEKYGEIMNARTNFSAEGSNPGSPGQDEVQRDVEGFELRV
jgi:hypothetical protein